MISQSMRGAYDPDAQDETAGGMSIDMPDEDGLNPDGSMTIDMGGDSDEPVTQSFTSNIAGVLDEYELSKIGSDLIERFEEDEKSRKEWIQAYIAGLDYLGIKSEDRTMPWNGACGVFHPVLMEAVVRFQAQSIMELFPPQGPAKV